MKFLKELEKILEQDEIELDVDAPEEAPAEEPTEEPTTEETPEPQVEKLSPESEVLLVRLIKKALVTEIDANDVDTLSTLGDINEKNAKQSLSTLINVMKKYSTDIDIES